MRKTRKNYEQFLNDLSPEYESDKWIIGGKDRTRLKNGRYGTALRRYDKIGFEVGFREWYQAEPSGV